MMRWRGEGKRDKKEEPPKDNCGSLTLGGRLKSLKDMNKKSFLKLGVELIECYVIKRKHLGLAA